VLACYVLYPLFISMLTMRVGVQWINNPPSRVRTIAQVGFCRAQLVFLGSLTRKTVPPALPIAALLILIAILLCLYSIERNQAKNPSLGKKSAKVVQLLF
jgi:hypothetical protein